MLINWVVCHDGGKDGGDGCVAKAVMATAAVMMEVMAFVMMAAGTVREGNGVFVLVIVVVMVVVVVVVGVIIVVVIAVSMKAAMEVLRCN